MRIPANLKSYFLSLLAIAFIFLAVIYVPRFVPDVGTLSIYLTIIGMFVLMGFVFVKPFVTGLFARADGIMEVYIDKSEKGFHVFSYHLNPSGENMGRTRDIQHYFILEETGKLFFKRLFSHEMSPIAGRAGWTGFSSFEENVLGTEYLKNSLQKLSAESHIDLQLGTHVEPVDDDVWKFKMQNDTIGISEYSTAADEGFFVVCTDEGNGVVRWKKKI